MDDNSKLLNELFTPEFQKIMKQQEELIEERRRTIKSGKNVIHLTYVGEFNDSELDEINETIINGGLVFSWYNKSGIVQNDLDLYQLVTCLTIAHPIIVDILKGVCSNVVWDTIKLSTIKILEKLNVKKYNKISGGKIEERKIKFGIHVHLDKNTGFDFELNGDVSKEEINESLDKILAFLGEQKLKEKRQISDYVYYNPVTKQWVKIDVEKEIHKIFIEKTSKHKPD